MNSKKITFVILSLFLFVCKTWAQSDTSFWFAAPQACSNHEKDYPIYFRISSYESPAEVTISQPANANFIPIKFHLNAYQAITIDSNYFKTALNTTSIQGVKDVMETPMLFSTAKGYGISIKSSANISAYYEMGKTNNPEIFSLKGKVGKGLQFLVPGQTRFGNAEANKPKPFQYLPQPKNGFIIVATEDNTNVNITLSNPDIEGHAAGSNFSITLNKGESYAVIALNWQAGTHLGGSRVSSDKPISITIYDDSIGPDPPNENRDIIGDQIVPTDRLGNTFIIIRGALSYKGSLNQDYYYIWATADNTEIKVNGIVLAKINTGQSYEGILTDASAFLETSNPAYVYQLTGNGGEMASTNLPYINCSGSQLVSFVRSTGPPQQGESREEFQLNILCKASTVNNFLFNGQSGIITPDLFQDVPGTNGEWKAARIDANNLSNINSLIVPGISSVVSNTFGLFHLGFLNGSSGTGSRLGYFSNYGVAHLFPSYNGLPCIGNDLQLTAQQIPDAASYRWTGPNNFLSNTKDVTLPSLQQINSGNYIVQADVPGCGTYSDTLSIQIHPLPIVALSPIKDTVCLNSQQSITASLTTGDAPWQMGLFNGKSDTSIVNISTVNYLIPYITTIAKTYTYNIFTVTDKNGCSSTNLNEPLASAQIVVNPLPTVSFNGNDTVCLGKKKTVLLQLTGKAPWQLTLNDGTKDSLIDKIQTADYQLLLSPTVTTTYTIKNIVDGNGCTTNANTTFTVTVLPLPIAGFVATGEVCLHDTTFFTDKSTSTNSTNITQWQWFFGDGSSSNVQNPTHIYGTAQTSFIKLVVTNNLGCISDTVNKSSIINPLPVAKFNTLSTPFYCENKPVIFTDASSTTTGTITRWHWNLGDGRLVDTLNGNPFTNTYTTFKSYSVQLMVENSKGCKSDTVSQSVVIHPQPTVSFVVPEACISDQVTFTDNSTIANGDALLYQWNINATNITPNPILISALTAKNPTVQYQKAATYSIINKVTSATNGCTASKTQLFTVNGATPKATFNIVTQNNICANQKVQIRNTSTVDFGVITKIEIYWDAFGKPNTKFIASNPAVNELFESAYADFNSPNPKTFTIKLVAYSGTNCVNTTSQNITINPNPKLRFTAIPNICNDTTPIQITQAAETSGLTGTVIYSGNSITNSGLFSPRKLLPGKYPLTFIFQSTAGCADTIAQNIEVLTSPVADFSLSSITCENSPVTFTDASVAAATTIANWNWNFGDGNKLQRNNALPFTKTYTTARINNPYNVSLRVMDNNGCNSSVVSKLIDINFLPSVSFSLPKICLPDGNGAFVSTSTIADGSDALFGYKWNFDDPNNASSSVAQRAQHQYSAVAPVNGYQVQLQVTSNKGCMAFLTQAFKTVFPQPIANFVAVPDKVCTGDTIRFFDKSAPNAISWQWNLGQGFTATHPDTLRKFTDSGSYTISLQITDVQNCSSNIATQKVTIYPKPHLSLGSTIYVLDQGLVPIKPNNGGLPYYYPANASFLWSSATSPNYLDDVTKPVPIAQGFPDNFNSILYHLKLSYQGCSVTDSIRVTILHDLVIPNAFSPNGDNVNDTWVIEHLYNYPNAVVEVFNRYGQLVYHSDGYNKAWDGTYNGKPLPMATYYYIIDTKKTAQKLSGSITILR